MPITSATVGTRHRRGDRGLPAGQRLPVRAGSTSPTRSRRGPRTRTPTWWCCAPRAAASTPASTSRRCSAPPGFDALIGANRGCFAAFKAVYECAVPVVAAVNGFCVGGGVGLVGNADCIVASDDAYFGVPEVERGALGAATHLARLVPQHLMRTLFFTGRHHRRGRRCTTSAPSTRWCPATELDEAALRVAARDRRQGHPGDPGRQGGAQRHRPDRRQHELPVRAGVHLRAQPVRRLRRAARRLRRHEEGASSDQGTPRQANDHRRRRRPRRGRHDHRHRRLGIAAQADGARPRDPAHRPQGPHRGQLRRRPTSACSARPARSASSSTRSSRSTPPPLEPWFSRARQEARS